MPRQTRVDPSGALFAVPARGTLMGNRGCLHNENQQIVRQSGRTAWVCCLLEFKGIRRPLMAPRCYTELFFLDEATALAAGHRPCNTCRRDDARAFATAWARGNGRNTASAAEIDAVLSKERTQAGRITLDELQSLPDGVVVRQEASGTFFLLLKHSALAWSFEGYGRPTDRSTLRGSSTVMTPPSVIRALENGYQPRLHSTAIG